MCADDTALFCEIKKGEWKEKIREINNELQNFSEWCKANFLTINVKKTRCMMFGASKQRLNKEFHDALPALFLNGERLTYVDQYKYLGINLDKHLRMALHVDQIIKRCKPSLYSLTKLRHYLEEDVVIQIYKTYMMPIVENGLYLIDNPVQIERLQKLQNKALRICYRKVNTYPSFPLHQTAYLLSLDLRRKCSLRT